MTFFSWVVRKRQSLDDSVSYLRDKLSLQISMVFSYGEYKGRTEASLTHKGVSLGVDCSLRVCASTDLSFPFCTIA